MLKDSIRRGVFFDLDGTLHKQDMLGSFIRYLLRHLPLNIPLVLLMLPVIGLGLMLNGRAARWPMSLLLWSITFGRSMARLKQLEHNFVEYFRARVTPFPLVQQRLSDYLMAPDADVWLITGSPQCLVAQVYRDAPWLESVNLIGSQMARGWGGYTLPLRCLGMEKVGQLERRLGRPLLLHSGYSDSKQDNPLLAFCQHRWRVTAKGELRQLE